MRRIMIFMAVMMVTATVATAKRTAVTLKNTLGSVREVKEMVELPMAVVEKRTGTKDVVVTMEDGSVIPSQQTYDGKLIFICPELKAKQTKRVFISSANEQKNADDSSANEQKNADTAAAGKVESSVFGRLYPERQSDFSFENDRIAYRIYGPETQKNGGRLYGYDIFNKRTDKLYLDRLYALQCDGQMWHTHSLLQKMGKRDLADDLYNYGFCYHVDHGEGMDCYKVGSTLGAGTNALIDKDGKIVFPWCFKTAEILDNGPLRLTVKLTYDGEERLLQLDAQSSMVKATVTYTGEKSSGMLFASGIAVHKENPDAYILNKEKGIIAYEDLGDPEMYAKRYRAKQDPEKGHIFIGAFIPDAKDCVYMPFDKETTGATGHVMVTKPFNGTTETYYFGNAWDKNERIGITTLQQWEQYMIMFANQKKSPLKVTF